MTRPDLLITHIKHTDYPLFRKTLEDHRNFFGKVIIYFSEHNRDVYFDSFIRRSLEHLDITVAPEIKIDWGTEDWRNMSTNHMLTMSDSQWVCSIEQDWFVRDWNKLLGAVTKAAEDHDLIGWWQENNNYIHPAFWFIKRDVLEQTSKDFAAHDGHDHFGWITKDVEKLGVKIRSTQDMGFVDFEDCFHLGGVNQNYLEGMKEGYVFHRPEVFMIYNWWCRRVDVEQSKVFIDISLRIEEKLRKQFPYLNLENNKWVPFFSTKG